MLARYGHLEDIPAAAGQWDVAGLRGAAKLAATLQDNLELAVLFRLLATLVTDIDVGTVDVVALDRSDRRLPGDGRTAAGARARRPGGVAGVATVVTSLPDDGTLAQNYGWR